MNHASTIEAIADSIDRCPLDVLEFFLERAAIREHDGGMERTAAEAEAVKDCLRHFAPSRPSIATLSRPGSDGVPCGESGDSRTSADGNAPTTQITHAWGSP